jgi:hypothetical protein
MAGVNVFFGRYDGYVVAVPQLASTNEEISRPTSSTVPGPKARLRAFVTFRGRFNVVRLSS